MAFNTMNAIKKKMHNMKMDKENVFDKVDQLDQKLVEQKMIYEKQREEVTALQKRISQIQNDSAQTKQQVEEAKEKLETTTTRLASAEAEVIALTKQVRSLEEEFELTDSRLQATSTKLEEASKALDESERGRRVLENRQIADEERIIVLERELEQTIMFGEEADRKYEETARRLATIDVDLERSLSTLASAEAKILELEEELQIVGNNMKSLEISEQEAALRQENYEQMIVNLTSGLQDSENRAIEAEKAVSQLQKEVDRLEGEVSGERDKFRLVSSELDSAFSELTGF